MVHGWFSIQELRGLPSGDSALPLDLVVMELVEGKKERVEDSCMLLKGLAPGWCPLLPPHFTVKMGCMSLPDCKKSGNWVSLVGQLLPSYKFIS